MPQHRPHIAYVMPTYGHFDYARACLQSLMSDPGPAGIVCIIVDDGSPDWNNVWYDIGLGQGNAARTVAVYRFDNHGGLTRSWNAGMAKALKAGKNVLDLVVAGNDDVLLPHGWWRPMQRCIHDSSLSFVGPLSNAPGTSNAYQQIKRWQPGYALSDDLDAIAKTQKQLEHQYGSRGRPGDINGFFMAATPAAWLAVADNPAKFQVFPEHIKYLPSGRKNPTPRMTAQECWLASRAKKLKLRMGISLGSFIFHYRSVSRGTLFCSSDQMWMRRKA